MAKALRTSTYPEATQLFTMVFPQRSLKTRFTCSPHEVPRPESDWLTPAENDSREIPRKPPAAVRQAETAAPPSIFGGLRTNGAGFRMAVEIDSFGTQ